MTGVAGSHFTESLSEKTDTVEVVNFSEECRLNWNRVLELLRPGNDPQIFAAYLEPLALKSFDIDVRRAVVSAPSKFVLTQVERNFSSAIETSLKAVLSLDSVQIAYEVDTERVEAGNDREQSAPFTVVKRTQYRQRADSDRVATPPINPKYTFDTFVVGSNNQFCHAAAMQVADSPGYSYNPLFIYGGVGLGKTHVLHAIGNAVLQKNPFAKVYYCSSESFTNDLILSLRNAKMDDFKNRFRSVDLLLIDDIQFMCGKERTQEEFFHTFNALYNSKRQIVITSDKIPQEIPGLEDRLRTRFSWGLTADLQAPDFETRVAILKRKAASESFELPEDVAHMIAEKISNNVRELEGALTRLHAVCSLQNRKVTLEVAESALRPLLQPKTVVVSVDDIKRAVANRFNVKVSELVSKRRTKNLSVPRHVAMYLCRKHTSSSYPEIGSHFGGRDHSSVIHATNTISNKLSADPFIQERIQEVERDLFG